MAKIKLIDAGKIDPLGWKKVGKGLIIALSGAVLTFLVDLPAAYDFGPYAVIVAAVIATGVNFFRKLLTTYESK